MISQKKVAVIGSGVGGLCCGIRLAHAGYDVSIYEKEATPGGVVKHCKENKTGIEFDSFATIGIHPCQYVEIFHDVGLDPNHYFKSMELDELYKVFYEDGTSFSLPKKYCEDKKAFEDYFGESLDNYTDFVNTLTQKYLRADRFLLTKPLLKAKQILNAEVLKSALTLAPISTARHIINKYVKSKKLQDLLLFQTFYMGLSPKKVSNVYASIPAVTQTEGLLYIMGGMGAYISALVQAFTDLGGHLFCNMQVHKILMNHSKAVGLQCGNDIVDADIIVSNADYNFTLQTLLPKPHQKNLILKSNMSCSVFVLRLALNIHLPMLSTHNIVLPDATEAEIDSVSEGKTPHNPPLYIYYPSNLDSEFKKSCPSCLNIMLRVPNLSEQNDYWDNDMTLKLEELCINKLIEITRIEQLRDAIICKSISTPLELASKFNCWEGAAFGLAPSYLQSAFLRPQLKLKGIEQLYLVGSSIHPGNGISIVMKGAKLTAQQIITEII